MLADDTVAAFEKYSVLSKRELESRYEVWVEQYAIRANIEAEETLLDRPDDDPAGGAAPAGADRRGRRLRASRARSASWSTSWSRALGELKTANAYPDDLEGLELAIYARDKQLAAMDEVREAADKLEKVVADDLWPLPKYEEMLFIK